MLIDSPRLTERDRQAWRRLEQYDAALGQDPRLEEQALRGIRIIEEFAGAGPCYASVSWGKDSVVMSDLLARSTVAGSVPLVWVRVRDYENPDCEPVRDAFLAKHPHMRACYEEIEVPATSLRWWDDGQQAESARTLAGGFAEAERRYGARHISGIRAEESKIRRIVQGRWGDASTGACRPIGRWTAVEVFAYLHARQLPVHPAYAMSVGGRLDRRWLRVASIGGVRGADRGRAEWEATYYPDIVQRRGGAS